MNATLIAAVAGGVFILLAIIGALASRQERVAAPEQLERAQQAFEQGEWARTLALLDGALHVPLDDRYRRQDAALALSAVNLLGRLIEALGGEPLERVGALREALSEAARQGGHVPRRFSSPVKKMLQRASSDPALAAELVAELRARAGAPAAPSGGEE